MSIDFQESLKETNRLLIEVELSPLQGHRFQSTGFPNLGAAVYTLPNGKEMLLVESAQSIANRLEAVCWDDLNNDLAEELKGLPYVQVMTGEPKKPLTNSILEAHRLNSPYILESGDDAFFKKLQDKTKSAEDRPVDINNLAQVVFGYDPCNLLHGIFFSKKELAGGRLRLQRLLSGFIEAENTCLVESGGVKNDRINPSGSTEKTKKGFGNVPFSRTEFTAERITAYFNFDLATLTGYNLKDSANKLLISLAFWKIRRFLEAGLRLRTACDFKPNNIKITKPVGFEMPGKEDLVMEIKQAIKECAEQGLFADPVVTEVSYKPTKDEEK